jgi:hypothetical protein
MPNHLHALIDFGVSERNINTIVSNGKRFMAYEIVKRFPHWRRYAAKVKWRRRICAIE